MKAEFMEGGQWQASASREKFLSERPCTYTLLPHPSSHGYTTSADLSEESVEGVDHPGEMGTSVH